MQLHELHPVAESQAMRRAHQHFVVDFEVLDEDVEHAPRHALFDLEQGRRAVPELAQALVDGFEQVVGLVFLNHHVGVADDAEDMRALDRRAREQRLDVGADDVFDEHERRRRRRPGPAAAARKRGSTGGSLMRANFVRPSCLTATARFLLRLEMCGNGCPGSKASGVSTGAISRWKYSAR